MIHIAYVCTYVHYIPDENAMKITCKCLSQAEAVSLKASNLFDKDSILIEIKYICAYSIYQIYDVCMYGI